MHQDARALLQRLVRGQRDVLGDSLVGSYVFGSAVTGDYEPGISDVDTVAVLRADPTDDQLERLASLHRALIDETPEWDDRVEAVYLSTNALATFRSRSPAARISPGEPFRPIEVDERWLIDWYQLREVGVTLHGPPAATLVPPIGHGDHAEAVRRHLLDPGWLDGATTPGDRAYAILTMCRGLRTVTTGDHVSKREGARWASEALPEHADLIHDALAWRSGSPGARPPDEAATRRLVSTVQRRVT